MVGSMKMIALITNFKHPQMRTWDLSGLDPGFRVSGCVVQVLGFGVWCVGVIRV